MNFVAFDFETSTNDRNSPCEIGLTFVENWEIINTKSWLIKPINYPYFKPYNISIHGIKPLDVANEPEFDFIWKEVKPLIEHKLLIAHYASFDISVLKKTLETYKIEYPTFDYLCSKLLAMKVWQGLPEYGLKPLCVRNNIEFNHHRAADDSEATAKLTIKAFQAVGVNTIEELSEMFKLSLGKLNAEGSIPFKSHRTQTFGKSNEFKESVIANQNPNSIFYEKTVSFTGTLTSMVRKIAQQTIIDIGGEIKDKCTMDTDFLIVGQQEYKNGMGNSHLKAIKMVENGSKIEILSEEDFLKNI